MVIKTDKKKQLVDKAALLEKYVQQGRSYRKTGQNHAGKNFIKGSLAAMLPLAAAGALNAQCLGSMGSNLNVGYGSGNGIKVDVDGDLVDDFVFFYTGLTVAIQPLNGGSVGANVTSYGSFFFAKNYDTGVTLTGGGVFGTGFHKVWYFSGSASQYISFDSGNSDGNIHIIQGGKTGWIKINIDSNTQMDIFDRGVDIDGGTTIAGDCASLGMALPVELLYFRAEVLQSTIRLEWATASEQNNSGFEVQRSTNGRDFHKIGWVTGQGITTTSINYAFEDTNVQVNTNYYYRLKQLDQDGTESYTPVQVGLLKDTDTFQIGELFPNPVRAVKGYSLFRLKMPKAGEMNIQLFDVQGKLQKELTKSFVEGQSTLSIPVQDVPEGQYFVKLQSEQSVVYRKLVVK